MKYLYLIIIVVMIAACRDQQANKPHSDSLQHDIQKQIADGKRLETVDNDSMIIVSKKLFQLQKLTGDKPALVYTNLFGGLYHWQKAQKEEAMKQGLQALADADKYHVKQPIPQIYALIGNLNKEDRNYPMAFEAASNGLKAAINNKDTASTIALLGLNAMFKRGHSLSIRQPQLVDGSNELNLKALAMAEANPKYERIRTRFYDNIAQYYKDQRDFDKALYYGGKGVANALKDDQKRSLTYAYNWLGEVWSLKGDKVKGMAYLNKALKTAQDLHEPFRAMEINESISYSWQQLGDYKQAYHYYTVFVNMRDSLKVLDNTKQISDLQIKYESAKKDKEIIGLDADKRIAQQRLAGAIIILSLLVVIGMLYYLRVKNNTRLMNNELEKATLELQYFTENVKHQTEIIEEFKTEVEFLKTKNLALADTENLEKLMNIHLMTDESWESFKKLFIKVHGNFFGYIKSQYPNITVTDMRILSLIKLQLTNVEIAPMLGITVEGVRKSKHRLRKKMELADDANLESTIAKI